MYQESVGDVIQSRTNKETAAILSTPQPIVLNTVTNNTSSKLFIYQIMKDSLDAYFFAQFTVPEWCPPQISIGMKNKYKWIKEISSNIGWRETDEYFHLDWLYSVLKERPANDYIKTLYPVGDEDLNSVILYDANERVTRIVGVDDTGFNAGMKLMYNTDESAILTGEIVVAVDIMIGSENGTTYGAAPTVSGVAFYSEGATNHWGIVCMDGYILHEQDFAALAPPYVEGDVSAVAIGTYSEGDRMVFVLVIDIDGGTYDVYKDGVLLDTGKAVLGVMSDHKYPNVRCAGSSTVSFLFEMSVADHGTEADSGFKFEYLGIEGSIAKLLSPFILEIDNIKGIASLLHQSLNIDNDIPSLTDTHLLSLVQSLSGITLNTNAEKRALIRVLSKTLPPNPETILDNVGLFIGSVAAGDVYAKDTALSTWVVRVPDPTPADALWSYADSAKYLWLLDKIKFIATNVDIEWYTTLLEPVTWTPVDWVGLAGGIGSPLPRFHLTCFWDQPDVCWNDDGEGSLVWDAPDDWVTIQ